MCDTERTCEHRYRLLDAIRGFAAVNMIVYHLLYDLCWVYSLDRGFVTHPAASAWELCISFAFILISGASINLSHNGYRRGLIVLAGALLITVLTLFFLPEELIWFGVLNFLGCAILITYALRGVLAKLPATAGAGVSLLLFALLYGVPEGTIGFFTIRFAGLPAALYGSPYLAFLGLPSKGFHSADYFPLIPWLFLYFAGFYLWRIAADRGWDRYLTRRVPALDFIGRHCFVIYLVHQPVIFGVCRLVFGYI